MGAGAGAGLYVALQVLKKLPLLPSHKPLIFSSPNFSRIDSTQVFCTLVGRFIAFTSPQKFSGIISRFTSTCCLAIVQAWLKSLLI